MRNEKKVPGYTSEEDLFEALNEEEKAEADMMAEIAMQIHNKRIEMNMNQSQFAEYNGVSQAMVSKWESGEYNFSVCALAKIFRRLELSFVIQEKATA